MYYLITLSWIVYHSWVKINGSDDNDSNDNNKNADNYLDDNEGGINRPLVSYLVNLSQKGGVLPVNLEVTRGMC